MEIEGEGWGWGGDRQQRYKEMTGGTGESRESKNKTLGRLTAMIPIIAFLRVIFFSLPAGQIFKSYSHIADICITCGADGAPRHIVT